MRSRYPTQDRRIQESRGQGGGRRTSWPCCLQGWEPWSPLSNRSQANLMIAPRPSGDTFGPSSDLGVTRERRTSDLRSDRSRQPQWKGGVDGNIQHRFGKDSWQQIRYIVSIMQDTFEDGHIHPTVLCSSLNARKCQKSVPSSGVFTLSPRLPPHHHHHLQPQQNHSHPCLPLPPHHPQNPSTPASTPSS
jgi:hypothetical protein